MYYNDSAKTELVNTFKVDFQIIMAHASTCVNCNGHESDILLNFFCPSGFYDSDDDEDAGVDYMDESDFHSEDQGEWD